MVKMTFLVVARLQQWIPTDQVPRGITRVG
jgi:hypothetical protein